MDGITIINKKGQTQDAVNNEAFIWIGSENIKIFLMNGIVYITSSDRLVIRPETDCKIRMTLND